jgi:hypothetical protein
LEQGGGELQQHGIVKERKHKSKGKTPRDRERAQEQVKRQNANRKRQSQSEDANRPGVSFRAKRGIPLGSVGEGLRARFLASLGMTRGTFAFCVLPFDLFFGVLLCLLRFAFCLLTSSCYRDSASS